MSEENKKDVDQNLWSFNLDNLQVSDEIIVKDNPPEFNKIDENNSESANQSYLNLDLINKDVSNFESNDGNIVLGDDWMRPDMSKVIINRSYRKLFILSFFGMIIFSLSTVGLFIYNSYLEDLKESVTESKYDKYINEYVWFRDKVFEYLFNKSSQNISNLKLADIDWTETLKSFLKNPAFDYVKKRDVLQNSLWSLIESTNSVYKNVNEKKDYITQYGFFTQELKELLKDQENISNIKRSLLSLENIKFSSAIHVFYNMDTFIDWFSKSLNISKDEVNKWMKEVIDKWEKNIMTYLETCYLNPFEIDYDCNAVWDFDMYYKINDQNKFDTQFFKKLIYYIDLKLEQTEIPSFSIIFNWFNANSNQISFSINVDTFRQDELSLIRKWISNPHIFIVNNLINFLKQSKFILWKNITTKNIRVVPRVITIWSNEFSVNHSAMNFSLPIQKEMEREIFDFVEIKK
jgi:hypothetical protein